MRMNKTNRLCSKRRDTLPAVLFTARLKRICIFMYRLYIAEISICAPNNVYMHHNEYLYAFLLYIVYHIFVDECGSA